MKTGSCTITIRCDSCGRTSDIEATWSKRDGYDVQAKYAYSAVFGP